MPTKVAHVVLVARDPQASAVFYADALGMQRVWDFDQLDPDGNRLEFFSPTMEPVAAMDCMRAGRAGLDPYDIEPVPFAS